MWYEKLTPIYDKSILAVLKDIDNLFSGSILRME